MQFMLVTLLALLNDVFANDNSSLFYCHDYNFVACCYCTKCLSIFLELALKSLSEQYFGDRMMTKYNYTRVYLPAE